MTDRLSLTNALADADVGEDCLERNFAPKPRSGRHACAFPGSWRQYMFWWVVGAIAVFAAAGWVWWWWPKHHAERLRLSDPQARAEVEDNFRKTIGQAVGGLAVLFGALLAYRQFSEQMQSAQLQFSEQQKASRELLVSNQVSKGFEQLGSKEVMVRLGGIYALEGAMNSSEQYHRPVLEALSAFVRDGTQTKDDDTPPTIDIQAALTVIGRRVPIGITRVNLANARIPRANLVNADLDLADLNGAQLD
jgi:Pentapeptide repeats (8 copies)